MHLLPAHSRLACSLPLYISFSIYHCYSCHCVLTRGTLGVACVRLCQIAFIEDASESSSTLCLTVLRRTQGRSPTHCVRQRKVRYIARFITKVSSTKPSQYLWILLHESNNKQRTFIILYRCMSYFTSCLRIPPST